MLIRRLHITKFGAIKRRIIPEEIQTDIEAFEKNASLLEEANFIARVDAIDYIEFHILDRIEGLLLKPNALEELFLLKQHAEGLKSRLEEINTNLFSQLRANIRQGIYTPTGFKNMVNKYCGISQDEEIEYSNLDIFINGLLHTQPIPPETMEREPDMVFYQKTPAKIVFELVEKAQFKEGDFFYDLGSGLGQVSILVNLLSGVSAKGVEFEPAYCDYAKACATELNIQRVEFINADVRNADYEGATVFFMYTPFEGAMLQQVMDILKETFTGKKIRLFTYGPCTANVNIQSWLYSKNYNIDNVYKLCEFSNFRA